MANAEGLTQLTSREQLRSSRSIQEFRIDFLLEEEFACDLALVQQLVGLSGLEGTALRVERIIHSLHDRHGEADLVAIIDIEAGGVTRRVALLIENKISAGAQPNQARRYRDRGKEGLGKSWDDFKTILIAPAAYSGEKAFFDRFVPLEQISQWLCPDDPVRAAFRKAKIQEAIEKRSAAGVQIVDTAMTDFRAAYYEYLMAFNAGNGTDFTMRQPGPTYDGDTWFSLNSISLPPQCRIRHRSRTTIKARTGVVDITFLETSVDRLEPLRHLLEPSMSILSSGRRRQHASIEVNVSEINEKNGFEHEKLKIQQALLAAKRFRRLIVDNIDLVHSEVSDSSHGQLQDAGGSKGDPSHNAALHWKLDGSVCPTCGGSGRNSERYPAAVCQNCEASVLDGHGKTVKLFNDSMSGGLLIMSGKRRLTGALAERLPLFVKGIECRAREHRFGGVVLQPAGAWKASETPEL
jgi:hypothetical protein